MQCLCVWEKKIKYLRGVLYLANEVVGGAFPAGYSCCPRCAAELRGGPACWSLAAGPRVSRLLLWTRAPLGRSGTRVPPLGPGAPAGGLSWARGRDRSSSVRAGLGNEALFAGAQGHLAAADPRALTKLQESWGSAVPPVALSSFRLQGGVRVSRTARARRLQACGFDQVLLKSFSAGLQNI